MAQCLIVDLKENVDAVLLLNKGMPAMRKTGRGAVAGGSEAQKTVRTFCAASVNQAEMPLIMGMYGICHAGQHDAFGEMGNGDTAHGAQLLPLEKRGNIDSEYSTGRKEMQGGNQRKKK